jgi:hypothetical protein
VGNGFITEFEDDFDGIAEASNAGFAMVDVRVEGDTFGKVFNELFNQL